MKLTTEEKLSRTTEMHPPQIIELLDIGTSHQKVQWQLYTQYVHTETVDHLLSVRRHLWTLTKPCSSHFPPRWSSSSLSLTRRTSSLWPSGTMTRYSCVRGSIEPLAAHGYAPIPLHPLTEFIWSECRLRLPDTSR